jgi:1-acyl-sn-glycerol-3-phosphate acyltransferase
MTDAVIDRHQLVGAITAFLSDQDAPALAAIREVLEREIDEAGPDAVANLSHRLAASGAGWDYYPGDPLARRIHEVLANTMLQPGSELFGIDHINTLGDAPIVIFANHLSYSDANLLEILLRRAGGASLAARLTAMAGLKVYSSLKRRFSSLCFGTIKTPQNSSISSEDAVMSTREVARAARRCIEIAHERLSKGDALVVFAEGRRSRTQAMQPMLAGASRYLDGAAEWVLPIGIAGTEGLFPVGEETLHPVRVVMHAGRPLRVRTLLDRTAGNRRLLMDVVGLAIAGLVPLEYRGVYGDDVPGLDEARGLLHGMPD